MDFLQKLREVFGLRLWAAKLIEKYPKLNTMIIIASFAMDLAIIYAVIHGVNAALSGFQCPIKCGYGGSDINFSNNLTFPVK